MIFQYILEVSCFTTLRSLRPTIRVSKYRRSIFKFNMKNCTTFLSAAHFGTADISVCAEAAVTVIHERTPVRVLHPRRVLARGCRITQCTRC